ncbi:MAG: DUF368 domain-containing protein, partial [Planctomycetota bacterium]|nr:DUF368 domain-containing protein [Planctomycetota bacterium]
ERLIDSIHVVLRLPLHVRTPEGRALLAGALRFLVPLAVGVGAAYFVGTRILVGPPDSPGLLRRAETAPLCYAFFTGLVLFSLREPWHRIERVTATCWIAAVVACVAVAWAVTLEHTRTEPEPWMLLYGGALAIAVMLLPGISGSLMLLVLGQYTTVASAVHAPDFALLGTFLVGIVLGLLLFVPVLRRLLRTHHDVTMAALTGLMAGSLVALWPWKSHYDLKDESLGQMTNVGIGDNWPLVLLFAALGAAAVWGLRALERRIDRSA